MSNNDDPRIKALEKCVDELEDRVQELHDDNIRHTEWRKNFESNVLPQLVKQDEVKAIRRIGDAFIYGIVIAVIGAIVLQTTGLKIF